MEHHCDHCDTAGILVLMGTELSGKVWLCRYCAAAQVTLLVGQMPPVAQEAWGTGLRESGRVARTAAARRAKEANDGA